MYGKGFQEDKTIWNNPSSRKSICENILQKHMEKRDIEVNWEDEKVDNVTPLFVVKKGIESTGEHRD